MSNMKKILTVAVFALVIFGLSVSMLLLPDLAVSYSERRKLQQLPELKWEDVISGEYTEDLEAYLLDQFPLRDEFRTVKAMLRFYVFGQSDNNGVYLHDGSVFKMEYPLKPKQVAAAIKKINSLTGGVLSGMNVYYSVIPDKNYFAAEESGHMHIDYGELIASVNGGITGAEYIDIFPYLELSDYYRTDTHWRQDKIWDAANALALGMGAGEITPLSEYEAHTLSPFYGVYWGQSALPVKPDELTYLTSIYTENAVVTGVEFEGEKPVYELERFGGMDGYDIFLSGAQAIQTIEVPNAESDRELIIFRDSFGSSITPLLIGAYSKITLVDLRYIAADFVDQFVEFEDQDVLFLYSTSLFNSGMLLK